MGDGGTLLLDEIGDLSVSSQVKLLRVLQEGTFTRVGAESVLHSDARVIAATHRDLGALVASGEFREDLFYRLAVFEVPVPGLRERMEDLPRLVHDLVERIARRMGRPAPKVPRAALTRLSQYDWPGNVRELENRLEAALVMSGGSTLEVAEPKLELTALRVEPDVDVADDESIAALDARLADLRLDVLISNAGIQRKHGLRKLDFESMREQFEVNALGPLRVISTLRHRLGDGSKIAIVSSRMGLPGRTAA